MFLPSGILGHTRMTEKSPSSSARVKCGFSGWSSAGLALRIYEKQGKYNVREAVPLEEPKNFSKTGLLIKNFAKAKQSPSLKKFLLR